ncbi:hypothetical protein GW17_00060455 [Ensete ventricosum]|nr:hypothetical protein GW17_00060455 [Ensete ventricosum]
MNKAHGPDARTNRYRMFRILPKQQGGRNDRKYEPLQICTACASARSLGRTSYRSRCTKARDFGIKNEMRTRAPNNGSIKGEGKRTLMIRASERASDRPCRRSRCGSDSGASASSGSRHSLHIETKPSLPQLALLRASKRRAFALRLLFESARVYRFAREGGNHPNLVPV